MKAVVAGHICLDIIPAWGKSSLEALQPGRVVEMEGVQMSTGGAVANTGLALHRLGIETELMGKVGDDEFGQIILSLLTKQGRQLTEKMLISKGETSSYSIVLSPPNTDRVFLHYPGTNHTFSMEDIDFSSLAGVDYFHFGYPPLMRNFYANDGEQLVTLFTKLQSLGIVTSLDMAMPDPLASSGKADWPKLLSKVMPFVDVFLPSIEELAFMLDREESRPLTDLDYLGKLTERLIAFGGKVVVVKLGAEGLYLKTAERDVLEKSALTGLIDTHNWAKRELLVPAFKVKVQGTTGAGDSAIAGFIAAILQKFTPEKALTIANAVGAQRVESESGIDGITYLDQVQARINKGWATKTQSC